jgi:hypothetical protein
MILIGIVVYTIFFIGIGTGLERATKTNFPTLIGGPSFFICLFSMITIGAALGIVIEK